MIGGKAGGVTGETGRGVRWWLVSCAGLGVAVLTYLLQQLVIYVYVFGPAFLGGIFSPFFDGPELPAATQAERFGHLMGVWGMPALHLALTFGAALWVGRRVGAAAPLHGVLIGVVATVANQTIGLVYEPPIMDELVAYPILGVSGGLLGGFWGWNIRAGEEALHGVSRAVGAASGPGQISAAIGEHLAGSEVTGIGLWTTVPQSGGEGEERLGLAGSWTPRTARPWPTGVRPDALRSRLPEDSRAPMRLWTWEMPNAIRAAWESRGVRSALLVALVSSGGYREGILMVTSRKRRGFSRRDGRAYSTAASGAALALQNSRLLEEARQSATSRERQRMAHEIHDTLAQGFTSIVMNVEAAEKALPKSPQAVRDHHAQIGRTARESLTEARRLVWALRPEQLDDASLPDALRELAGRLSKESGLDASFEVTGTPRPLPAGIEATLLRCAQEALANVRKHAHASRAALTLSYMDDRVALDACDDGIGFDPEAAHHPGDTGGFGIGAMRERVRSAGGTLAVESALGEGTALALELPLAAGPVNGHAAPGKVEEPG